MLICLDNQPKLLKDASANKSLIQFNEDSRLKAISPVRSKSTKPQTKSIIGKYINKKPVFNNILSI